MNSHTRLTLFLVFMSMILIFSGSLPLQAQKKPQVYGKVFFQASPEFKKPLARAQIQLLEITRGQKPGKILYQTYTSNTGNFAFYRLLTGKYHLKIIFGKEIFFQLKDKQKVEVSVVEVRDTSKSIQLPDIIAVR